MTAWRSPLVLFVAALGMPAAWADTAAPAGRVPAVTESGARVMPAPLPSQEPAVIRDPTKVTPAFEKTFRELSGETRGTASPASSAAAPGSGTLPPIRLVGRMCHRGYKMGSVLIGVGNEVVRLKAGGEGASVYVNGQLIKLRVDYIGEDGVHLAIPSYGQSLMLQ